MKEQEIKITLIGDAKTGKTSLLKRLKEDTFQPDEAPTDGINIVDIDFGVCDTFREQKSIHGITGHFWDFGGQEMMQATHQFFLTKRSIYILVLHANNDANNPALIRNWVKQISLTGGNSPVIVVANQLDTNPNFDFANKRELRDEFPQIKVFLKVSCKENTNIGRFKNELAEIISTVELFQPAIPESWMKVKNRLQEETRQKCYVDEARFLEVCHDAQLTDREEQKLVIRFLNEIGLILHFDHINLSEYYVLDPYWITYGAYQILTSKYAGSQKGIVVLEKLEYIVNEEEDKNASYQPVHFKKIRYSPNERRFLIDMLHAFKICIRTPDGSRFIIPDLLDTTEPETEANPIRNSENTIRFAYEYDYLPKSVLPNMIIETYSILNNMWRTGCILQKDNCKALITNYQNMISIVVVGEHKQRLVFLSFIRDRIDAINHQLNINPKRMIPLPGVKNGYADYERLRIRKEKGKTDFIFDEDLPTEKRFSISSLLEGISKVSDVKKIPYEISNFESLRYENYAYVDKTRFIEKLENDDAKYHFFVRPRKFGKSLFLSMLFHYYDICAAEKFDVLFGDLYIGKNPTPKRNDYFVLNFDFSGIDTNSIKGFNSSLLGKIKSATQRFFIEHKNLISNYNEHISRVWNLENTPACLEFIFNVVKSFGKKLFVVIDEYDHFANDMIASGSYLGEDNYKKTVWAGSQIRDFYETLKANSKTVVDKMFITGITPVMLDDITSGFNISSNLSNDVRYNEMLGFTEDEVEFLIDECGIERERITINREFLYNGYSFHKDADNKLYNSSMIINLLYKAKTSNGIIKELMNDNLKTDYGRIKNLLYKPVNIEKLEEIIELNIIPAEVSTKFSIDNIHDTKNFLSLLYYMGLLTIDNERGMPMLKIPNYSIKTIYWEYMENIIMERNPGMAYNQKSIFESLIKMAYDNDYLPFFDDFHKNFVSQISNIDLENFSEKNVKFLLLSILFQNNIYLPLSETENSSGYSDIYLQRRNLYPRVQIDWVWEIKYIKGKDVRKKALIESKKKEAITQLQRYQTSNLFKDRTDVRYLAVVFVGKKSYIIQEIKKHYETE